MSTVNTMNQNSYILSRDEIIQRIDTLSSELKTLKSIINQPEEKKEDPKLTVELSGEAGSGKTTLAVLLAKYLESVGYGKPEYRQNYNNVIGKKSAYYDPQEFDLMKLTFPNKPMISRRRVVIVEKL